MMYSEKGWTRLEGNAAMSFLKTLYPRDFALFEKELPSVDVFKLPFYKGAALIRVGYEQRDKIGSHRLLFFLGHDNKFIQMNGTSTIIHDMNKKNTPKITEDTVVTYLKFFCFFVHADMGGFIIIEEPEDLELYDYMTDDVKEQVIAEAAPVKIVQAHKSGGYIMEATLMYGKAFFRSRFHAKEDGRVEMLSDEQLIEDVKII